MPKKKLFGNHIDANCEYCTHNQTPEASPTCALRQALKDDGTCTGFVYDPLLRTPRTLPPLQTFREEDFKL